jgi:hypothetical protein
MSFIHNHHIDVMRLTPSVVNTSNGLINNTVTSTVTAPATPTEGNLLIIQTGGVQNRTPADLTGWTKVIITHPTAGTDYYYYKVASASELTSWLLNFGSAIQGGWIFYELANCDLVAPFQALIKSDSGGISVATFDYPTYNISIPTLALMFIYLSAVSNTWVPTNSFTPATANSLNIYLKGAYKQYNDKASGEISGYTSSNGRIVFGGIMLISGKPIF